MLANWRLVVFGVVTLSLVGLLWSWDSRGDRVADLEREAIAWNNAITTLDGALTRNKEDIAECESINADNAGEIGRLKSDMKASEGRVDAINENADNEAARARHEAEAMRGRDTVCRTADGDLPEWLLSGVREPTAADRH